ncbi:hypothetical protein C5S29_11715 [ANME-1 cluster archaeon GoMg3.2]|nr:hypothetical protein [ANME-1 cluster archaeon GoMg3.2]
MVSNGLPPRLRRHSPALLELLQGQHLLAFAYYSGGNFWAIASADVVSYYEEASRDDVPGLLYEAASAYFSGGGRS